MANPKIPSNRRLNLSLKLSEDEYAAIREAAARAALTVSDWVRQQCSRAHGMADVFEMRNYRREPHHVVMRPTEPEPLPPPRLAPVPRFESRWGFEPQGQEINQAVLSDPPLHRSALGKKRGLIR